MKLKIYESDYLFEDIEAVKNYYPKISDSVFMELIQLDPTYRDGSNSLGKYGKWILNLYNKGAISEDDFGEITPLLNQFTTYRNRIKNKDLNSYKTLDDLDAVVSAVVDDDSMLSDRQKLRFKKNLKAGRVSTAAEDDYDVVFEDSQYIVYVPNTHEASMKLGKGTKWCTAHENRDWYDDYTQGGGKLYIIKDKSTSNMWQYSDKTASFLDQNDKVFDCDELLYSDDELLYFFSKILNYDLKDNKGIFTYKGTNPIPMFLREKIKKVIIVEGVEKIPDSCFAYCENLSEIIIPKSVNSIGTNAFTKTRFLRIKQKENPLVIINNILVNADYVSGKVMLPDNLISICPSVFCEIDVTEIIIPEKIKEIPDCLFYDCSVSKVKLPKQLRSIGRNSFYNCINLKKLVIPDTVEFIGSEAFEDCDLLTIYTKNDYVKNYCKMNGIPCKSLQKSKTESLKLRIKEDTACVASKTSYMDEDGLDKNGIYYFGDKPKLPVNWKEYKKDDNKKYGLKEKLRISESLIPNVVYHGGPVFIKPEEFSTNLIPCFFSPYEEYSSDYASKNKTSVVTAYRLDIRNPFYLGDKECLRVYKDEFIPWAIKKGYADDWMNQSKLMNPRLGDKISFVVADYLYPFLRGCRRKGIYDYDGMIVSEGNSLYDDSYVPFDNSQISLA